MSHPSRLPAILQAVMQGQPRALADSHYPRWHHAPVTGLMNDPNGFIEFAGRYHLFYQWNPLACDHKFKCWGTGALPTCCTGNMSRSRSCRMKSMTATAATRKRRG